MGSECDYCHRMIRDGEYVITTRKVDGKRSLWVHEKCFEEMRKDEVRRELAEKTMKAVLGDDGDGESGDYEILSES